MQIEAKIQEIEYDILLLNMLEGQAKKFKYLDHLPDNTPFGMVEVDMKPLIKKNIISK